MTQNERSSVPEPTKNFLHKVWDFAGQVGEFWVNKENIETRLKQEFDKTKAISDFVGMIVRFGFSLAATTYFGKRLTEPGLRLESYIFAFCWMTSLGLTIALVSGIMNIIFAYEMRAGWRLKAIGNSTILLCVGRHLDILSLVRGQ